MPARRTASCDSQRVSKQSKEAMEVDDEAQAPAEMIEVREDSFYHEGVEYNAAKSSLKELQALCREYQLKTQGSKKQLLSRLATAVREERLESQLQQRRQDYHENVVPFQQQPTSRPSDEEVEMHNLTHLPFQPWCEHCVATRGKEDPHKQSITKATSRQAVMIPQNLGYHLTFVTPAQAIAQIHQQLHLS